MIFVAPAHEDPFVFRFPSPGVFDSLCHNLSADQNTFCAAFRDLHPAASKSSDTTPLADTIFRPNDRPHPRDTSSKLYK